MRYRLDHEVRTPYDYRKIKLVASDEVGTRNIAAQMVENASLRNAIDVIGLHYTTFGDSYTNLLNEAYGKEIWYSEGSAPCNLSELTVQADQSGLVERTVPLILQTGLSTAITMERCVCMSSVRRLLLFMTGHMMNQST